jgi:lysophospholipase L1-like esterase
MQMTLGLPAPWASTYFEQTAGRVAAPCPNDALIIVAIGQSNAANAIGTRTGRQETLDAYNFFDGTCYRIEDPLIGTTGDAGSLWTNLAQRLTQRHAGLSVIVVSAAVKGASITDWLDRRSQYLPRLERQLAQLPAHTTPALIIWLQGEAEARYGVASDTYAARLEALISHIDALPSIRGTSQWLIFQTARCYDNQALTAPILAAQKAVATRVPGRILGPNTDAFSDALRDDGCHFNDQGRQAIVPLVSERIEIDVLPRVRPPTGIK